MMASLFKRTEVIQLLLAHPGIDVNMQNKVRKLEYAL